MKPTTTSPRINKTALSALRRQLKRLHSIYSWRKMAAQIYEGTVAHSVLQRIATDKGYIPADEGILMALDLIKKPNPYRSLPRWYKRTPEALAFVTRKREQIQAMSDEAKRQRKSAR